MGSFSAIGIDNNFSSRQACVTMGATYYKLSCGVDMVLYLIVKKILNFLRLFLFHFRNQDLDNILLDFGQHFFVILVKRIVLRRDHNSIDPLRHIII